MSISATRYVLITSGAAASAAVKVRELITRIFNDNPLIPVNGVLEFTDAADVGAYFGLTSPEYLRSLFYFGWVSKLATQPGKISFGRYAKATAPAQIFGAKAAYQVASFTPINAGSLNMEAGGQTIALNAINLSGCASLAAVATAVQAAIRGAGGTQFANATVTYDAVNQRFDFSTTVAGPADLTTPPTGTVATALGWTGNAVLSPGTGVQTIDQALGASAAVSNNFGSFAFVPALSTAEVAALAAWNNGQGVFYMGLIAEATIAQAETDLAAIASDTGLAVTFAPLAAEYPDMVPGIIMAATPYDRKNGAQAYMFQQFPVTPSVSDDATANALDAIRCNYYGQTQEAGQKIAFYQRGYLTGTGQVPVDQNTYANECWLKSAAQAALFTLMLSAPEVPANLRGRGLVSGALQPVIQAAVKNGVISVGDEVFSAQQQAAVSTLTGDPKAWMQVQNIGYWLGITFVDVVNSNGVTEKQAQYVLAYAKDDAIRSVVGSHSLI